MIHIRYGVFETNSSSTHSITICSLDEYKKLENNQLLIERWGTELLSFDEAVRQCTKNVAGLPMDEVLDILREEEIAESLETYGTDFETFEERYTTPGGEEIVAFGYYGRDC